MRKIRVLSIFGTRPEAIKMASVIKELRDDEDITSSICVTGQHREMLDQILKVFDIAPDFDLDLMHKSDDLSELSSNIIKSVPNVIEKFKPDCILVHGDTTTAMCSSLCALYSKIPLFHVEAGLRTDNISSPWPEEANRRVISALSSFHFAPTETARRNLLDENVDESKICLTGNTVIDSLNLAKEILDNEENNKKYYERFRTLMNKEKMVLITGHRRENFGIGFKNICLAIKSLSLRNEDCNFIYPVHLNPNVQKPVKDILGGMSNIKLIDPLDYLSFVYLMSNSNLILTDSGGIQEEAPTFNIPVVLMRETTERPEAVAGGYAYLVGSNTEAIIKNVEKLLKDSKNKAIKKKNPFGDGKASKRIVDFIKIHTSQNLND